MKTEKSIQKRRRLGVALAIFCLVTSLVLCLAGCGGQEEAPLTTPIQESASEATSPKTEPETEEKTAEEPAVFTVTFQDHDGKVIKIEKVKEGKGATAPADPTREGYTFLGWDVAFDNVTGDLVVTANYKANDPSVKTYTVTFKDHDGKVLKTHVVEEGQKAVAPPDPIREGYVFKGWDHSLKNVTSDFVANALYEKAETPVVVTYAVTFKDFDGTVLKTQTVEKGKGATAPAAPTREGYVFQGWDKAFDNVTSDLVVNATYKAETPVVVTFAVTFKDHDGTVLKTQTVEKGKGATAPAAPTREHFTFTGWNKAFDNVTSDLVVTATYSTTKFVISAEDVTVNKGASEVTVNLRVYNNPGIMGGVLNVTVNDQVFSFKSAAKNGYPSLTLTSPGSAATSSPYKFLLDAMELNVEADYADGVLLSITFKIDDTSVTGSYGVSLSCKNTDFFDENYNYLSVAFENGTITIK